MLELITAKESFPFSVAIAVMFGIALLEGITTVLGTGVSGFVDSLLPDFDFDADVDVDGDFDVDGHGTPTSALSKALSWLHVGEVPVLMLILIMLTAYGLIGWGIQYAVNGATGSFVPASVASIPALLLSFPVVRFFGGLLARYMPKDETDAVSEKSFIGLDATITLGTARHKNAAQAKLRDVHGTWHYVMVEPDNSGEEFLQGDNVVLRRLDGATYYAEKSQ